MQKRHAVPGSVTRTCQLCMWMKNYSPQASSAECNSEWPSGTTASPLRFLKVRAIMVAEGWFARGVGGGGGADVLCMCVCPSVRVCVSPISCPHTGTKCTSGLFSSVQGSISCTPKPRKLQFSQAENTSGIWTTGFTFPRRQAREATPTANEESIKWLYETAVYDWLKSRGVDAVCCTRPL